MTKLNQIFKHGLLDMCIVRIFLCEYYKFGAKSNKCSHNMKIFLIRLVQILLH